jgi:nicotinic acid mononucleotide adenylyltransferase
VAIGNFLYDLDRLLALRAVCHRLGEAERPAMQLLEDGQSLPGRVGVLAGSFNPLTNATDELVSAALKAGIDSVMLLVPCSSVDKEGVTRAAPYDRLLLLTQWAADRPEVTVAVTNRGLYADQALQLRDLLPDSEPTFVVGFDKIVQIFDPRYYSDRDAALDRLFDHTRFLVAPRQHSGADALRSLLDQPHNRGYAHRVVLLPVSPAIDDLSSTQVRRAVQDGEPWEHLVPPESVALIRETHAYDQPRLLDDGTSIDDYGLRLAAIERVASGVMTRPNDMRALLQAASSATEEGHRLRQQQLRLP